MKADDDDDDEVIRMFGIPAEISFPRDGWQVINC